MDNEIKKILRPIILLLCLMIFSSSVFYVLAHWEGQKHSFLRCLYMVTITISTIGYEDLLGVKNSRAMMTFNIVAIIAYMLIVAYTISNFTAFLVEGRLTKYFLYRKNRKRIKKMDQHTIICGIKDIGGFTARELHQTKRPFVVVDDDSAEIEALRQDIPDMVSFHGDATDDHILVEAGAGKAAALVAALADDKDNLYLVLAAREINPNIKIAAKYSAPRTRQKLLNAGAAYLVSPPMIGGMRIASELVRPQVVSFLDRMLRSEQDTGLRIEDLAVSEKSPYIGKTLGELQSQTGVLTIAYHDPQTEDFRYNPSADEKIAANMALIFIATPPQRQSLQKALNGA